MAKAVSVRHLLLGLLTQESMSGYDIKSFLESLNWLIDSPSFGSLYPALHALQEDGLVTVEEVHCQGKPFRKIYTITKTGEQTLREEMNQPAAPDASLKTFLMRLILANNLSQPELVAHLQQRYSQVTARRATLEPITATADGTMNTGQHLAFGYGAALANAELVWLNSTLEQLFQQPPKE